MSEAGNRSYLKMNGIGNAIIVLDLRDGSHQIQPEEARAIAAHEPYDQLMVLYPPQPGFDAAMRIFNRDGSQSQACGNGTRCVALYLMPRLGRDRLVLQTPAGRIEAWRSEDRFTVDMGRPAFEWQQIPLARPQHDTKAIDFTYGTGTALLSQPSVVNIGNPHVIFWVNSNPALYDLGTIGPQIERDPLFPEGVNVSLAHVDAQDHITLRVWERGAGLTLACGSAACAAAVAAARLGIASRRINITLPGGTLDIEWRQADDHVLMTGEASFEHEGRIAPAWFITGGEV